MEYLVKWKGYDDPQENTWEPASSFSKNQIVGFEDNISDKKVRINKRTPVKTEKYKSFCNQFENKPKKSRSKGKTKVNTFLKINLN